MFNNNTILKKRTYAFTLDLAIIVGVNYFSMAAFSDFLKIVFFHFPIHVQLTLIEKFKYVHSVSLLSFMFAYFSIFYFATNGQTMGKMILKLKVNASKEMTLTQSMLRAISYIMCAMFGSVMFILPFIRSDKKSLADLISGTTVTEDNAANVLETEFQLSLFDAMATENVVEFPSSDAAINKSSHSDEENKAA